MLRFTLKRISRKANSKRNRSRAIQRYSKGYIKRRDSVRFCVLPSIRQEKVRHRRHRTVTISLIIAIYFTTILTSFSGTTMTLTTFLPSRSRFAFSVLIAFISVCALSRPVSIIILSLTFPFI